MKVDLYEKYKSSNNEDIRDAAENYLDFVEREIKFQKEKNNLSEDDNIELLLVMHLMRIFPCK